MNLFNLAFGNIKKSYSDYAIYFLTLVIGVALFYMFNAVGSQNFMESIVDGSNGIIKILVRVIGFISVAVAVILGLLITYANNFLIKRRKKEFGVYCLLGMSERNVAGILLIETLFVGIISLLVGLLLGVFGAQLLSILVGKMFDADLSAFEFTFSGEVFMDTIICFSVIFISVIIFNVRIISRFKLIDLLNADKSSEKVLIKSPVASIVLFVLSLVMIAYFYIEIGFNSIGQSYAEFVSAILACVLGTFLFFLSLAGFVPYVFKKNKRYYYKGLNSFVCRQFSHNINTSVISFTVIAFVLFIAICSFSVGFSMKDYFNTKMSEATPVDFSVGCMYKTVSEYLEEDGIDFEEYFTDSYELKVYCCDYINTSSLLATNILMNARERYPFADWEDKEYVIRLSDYNRLEELYGRNPLSLGDNEYAIVAGEGGLSEFFNESLEANTALNASEFSLLPAYDRCIDECIIMSGTSSVMHAVIVPDYIIDEDSNGFYLFGSVLAGNYSDAGYEELLIASFDKADTESVDVLYSTKNEIQSMSVSISVSVIFVVLYIGVIFIITGAVIIALKILSDSMDSVGKYEILRRIGASEVQRNRALFWHVFINFFIPLFVSLCHSVIALRFVSIQLKSVFLEKMFGGTTVALVLMLFIYGGYFIFSYKICKRNVIIGSV